jgi:AAA domain
MMAFEFRPATRENVGLIIGLSGPSGSGKTYTALRLARGMTGDTRPAFIDTENNRAKHYADQFHFDHTNLSAPFTSDRYADAIAAAADANYRVIIVDSMSHEHAGEGGMLDQHEDELTRMAGTDPRKRESCSMAAWVKPKMRHKRMMQRLLQNPAHLILCFRAEQKIEMVKRPDGQWVIQPKQSLTGLDGWIAISEKNLPFELTVSVMLLPDAPGFPHWIKMPEQHRVWFPPDQPITEATGEALAAWAKGAPGAAAAVDPEQDWLRKVLAAKTAADLHKVGDALKAASDTLSAKTVTSLRAAYKARGEFLKRRRAREKGALVGE